MQCPDCQTENQAQARFCRLCGHSLAQGPTPAANECRDEPAAASATCSACQAPLKPGAAFCGRCGKPTATTPEVAPATSPAGSAAACPHCQAPLKPGAAFCGRCGKPTATTPEVAPATSPAGSGAACPHCQAPIKPGAAFCGRCGKATAPAAMATTTRQVAPSVVASDAADAEQAAMPAAATAPSTSGKAVSPTRAPPPAPSAPRPAPPPVAQAGERSGQRSALVPALSIAAVALLLLIGGGLWWRSREHAASSGLSPAPAAALETAPASAPAADAVPPESADVRPILGDWLASDSLSTPGASTPVVMLRISDDRIRLDGKTFTVRYRAEGDAIGAQSTDATSPDLDLRIAPIDADHLRLQGDGFVVAMVRKDSTAARALQARHEPAVPAIAPAARPTTPPPTARPAADPLRAAIAASLAEGRTCMAAKKYDCAISSANAVLRLAPGHTQALAMKRDAEAAQAQALSEIEIR